MLYLLFFVTYSNAASLHIHVIDPSGQNTPDAVIYLESATGQQLPKKPLPTVEIEQKHRSFIPLVTAIQKGTFVSFPNHDTVRHHVYSFSPAKTFELKLYSGIPTQPIQFDKVGTVVLGCNIHDNMIAYIQVVDTPYFTKTNTEGNAELSDLLPGQYILNVWHYSLPPTASVLQYPITITNKNRPVTITLHPKSPPLSFN